ncbi:hypothetical protein JD844_023743 [Phrynosoma platyrhinos]|uniref:GEN1 Holliday junction 5' flap endonuclease n=1 Tax=Phrynosoma platyrhinos TaxID=52577 RepID=A0ABQ7SXE8_PHRPL|nr:hypothetical protein JD844_023743 [Phrynosoma platyrhinos]
MGVTNLWQILEPVKQHVPLNSLKGKTLAVDLSLWVCEAQTVKKMMGVVTKPHLRNLFFRLSSLTLMGIHLVFVMEGDPPKLKANTMEKRTEVRFGPSKKSRTARTGRSRFKSLLKECLEMLECLGVPWVQAAGEAEAMCAYLNASGYVDGCITNDGDAFLYGAQTVYRNFNVNIKGVPGVGKEQALRLISTLGGQSLLQRFEHWKDHSKSGNIPPILDKKLAHCAVCHHPGSSKEHEHTGCHLCGTVGYCKPHDAEYCCPCEWHSSERHGRANTVEEAVIKKAKACEGFPFPEVIREYLISKDKVMKLNDCQRPNLLTFQHYATADDKPEEPFITTIEEAMLFQAAYPEVVALYQMEKLDICKEKKKGKKTKLKEKECLAGDSEVANLLSQLNLQSAYETFPCKDKKSDLKTDSSFTILPEKDSESQGPPVISQWSIPVGQSQKPSSALFMNASQNTKEECNLGGPVSSQAEFRKQSAAFPASSAIANLQLSGIGWEETSFSVSPIHVDVAYYLESESHTCTNSIRPHSLLFCEPAKTIMPSSDSVHYHPDLPSSVDCSASGNDLRKRQSDVSLKEEAILEPSILEAFSMAADTAPLSALQMVEQIVRTVSPREAFSSLSFQLNDSTQKAENVALTVKNPRRFNPQNKETFRSSKNPIQAKERLIDSDTCASVGLCREMLGLTCLENKPQALPLRSTEGIDHCQFRKTFRPPILKSLLKKSVCQNSYSSEDSDSENMEEKKKGHRMPKWQKKCDLVRSENKYIDKTGDSQFVQEIQQRREEPEHKALAMGFSVTEQSTVPIPNPPRLTECKPRRPNPSLEENGSDSDGWVNSPLPLSERLKLRMQNS